MLRENPLLVRGLTWGQKLMYLSTMWGYLSGFATLVYLLAPVLFLLFGLMPLQSSGAEFVRHLLPYLVLNQLCFMAVGWGRSSWRGQQYNLALFTLWIQALFGAIGNVFLRRKLVFVVTPKTPQQAASLGLVWPQISMIVLLNVAVIWALGQVALGATAQIIPIVLNTVWSAYNIAALSIVLVAARQGRRAERKEVTT